MFCCFVKADVPLGDVKLGELGNWFGRRNFSVSSMGSALSRSIWRYKMKYLEVKRPNAALLYHFVFITYTFHYFLYEYPTRSKHSRYSFRRLIYLFEKYRGTRKKFGSSEAVVNSEIHYLALLI